MSRSRQRGALNAFTRYPPGFAPCFDCEEPISLEANRAIWYSPSNACDCGALVPMSTRLAVVSEPAGRMLVKPAAVAKLPHAGTSSYDSTMTGFDVEMAMLDMED